MFINNRVPKERPGNVPGPAFRPRFRRFGHRQRGVSLVLVALSIPMIMGMAGLAIDLASLYVARSEAQRAADAAALAGAQAFVTSGYTSSLVDSHTAQTVAAQQAAAVGNQNLVVGENPQISAAGFSSTCPPAANTDGCFDFSTPSDPRITVVVQRTAGHGDPMPTFFMKIFGIQTADISASATAEAYDPSGGSGPSVGSSCIKPWILPNCDQDHSTPGNTNCPGSATFVNSDGSISNPGPYAGGVVGETLVLKPGIPSQAPAPSQFYPITIPPGSTPAICPTCNGPGNCVGCTTGGALYAQNIECCNTNLVACGQSVILNTQTGNLQGPTESGVECLINENKSGGTGQDTINTSVVPFQFLAGANNPLVLSGTIPQDGAISQSDSVVTVPVYNGAPLSPGQSAGTSGVTVIGFAQFFINSVDGPGQNQGNVHATVLNVAGCGSSGGSGVGGTGSGSGSGSSGTISGGGSSPIPVRLIHN